MLKINKQIKLIKKWVYLQKLWEMSKMKKFKGLVA